MADRATSNSVPRSNERLIMAAGRLWWSIYRATMHATTSERIGLHTRAAWELASLFEQLEAA